MGMYSEGFFSSKIHPSYQILRFNTYSTPKEPLELNFSRLFNAKKSKLRGSAVHRR